MRDDCFLYVDIRRSSDGLIDLIQRETKGIATQFGTASSLANYYVDRNNERSWWKSRRHDDGFLFYRYKVEIEPKDTTRIDEYIAELRALIIHLRGLGAKVTPACNFEDQLW